MRGNEESMNPPKKTATGSFDCHLPLEFPFWGGRVSRNVVTELRNVLLWAEPPSKPRISAPRLKTLRVGLWVDALSLVLAAPLVTLRPPVRRSLASTCHACLSLTHLHAVQAKQLYRLKPWVIPLPESWDLLPSPTLLKAPRQLKNNRWSPSVRHGRRSPGCSAAAVDA